MPRNYVPVEDEWYHRPFQFALGATAVGSLFCLIGFVSCYKYPERRTEKINQKAREESDLKRENSFYKINVDR
jgi:hypothetical protein